MLTVRWCFEKAPGEAASQKPYLGCCVGGWREAAGAECGLGTPHLHLAVLTDTGITPPQPPLSPPLILIIINKN